MLRRGEDGALEFGLKAEVVVELIGTVDVREWRVNDVRTPMDLERRSKVSCSGLTPASFQESSAWSVGRK